MNKIIFLFLIFIVPQSYGQNIHKRDSLVLELEKKYVDTVKLRLYMEVCRECEYMQNLIFTEPALKLADKILANSINNKNRKKILGWKLELLQYNLEYYANNGNQNKRLEYDKKRLTIYKELKDTVNIINTISTISYVYSAIGNIPKCLEYNKLGLAIFQKMKYKKGSAFFHNELAKTYFDNGDTIQALVNYQKGLKIYLQLSDTDGIALMYNNIGQLYFESKKTKLCSNNYLKSIDLMKKQSKSQYEDFANSARIASMYRDMGDFENAILYYQKSLETAIKKKQFWWENQTLYSIGYIYSLMGDTVNAIEYYNNSIKSAKENKYGGIVYADFHLAKIYFKQKNYFKAKENNETYLNQSKKIGIVQDIKEGELLASRIDSAMGNINSSYYHYKQYISYRDNLKSEEVSKAAAREKYQDEFEKQKVDQDKKDIASKNELREKKLQRNSFVVGFVLMILLAGISYRNFRRKKKDNLIIMSQKNLVEQKNREILDSIEYALRIQTAILPPTKIVKQYLENSFILYKPKDIVAGDFYWMETVGDLVLFAACDCTGHGVPGAMVSVVCHNALNRAVREFGLTQPAAILDKTAEIVLENFSKSEEEIQDGMDISICSFNTKSKLLEWAGANNPLWFISNGNLTETKADKQCIGYNDNIKPFTNHQFNLDKETNIYLFTDGFADQFGGQPERKLTKNRFRELLMGMQHLTIQQQSFELDNFIKNYKNEIEQTDDILIIGVRV
jgi:serine phosphatase RsbU (regulator of sigma subunit)